MDTAAEFHRHATDCAMMAKGSHDPKTRAGWDEMAQRWEACAKRAEEEDLFLRRRKEENQSRLPRRWPAGTSSPESSFT
jgi:hypothetical protein